MMRFTPLALALWLSLSPAFADDYPYQDLSTLQITSETPQGTKRTLNMKALDVALNHLVRIASDYPPNFHSSVDLLRAIDDIKTISDLLDAEINVPKPDQELLLRAAHLNSMGYNLDLPGTDQKAINLFKKLLAMAPDHPKANFLYGTFLAGIKNKEAIPFLEKAVALGVADAPFALGMTYLILDDQAKALQQLENYLKLRPDDTRAKEFANSLRHGKVTITMKQHPQPKAQ